MYRGLGPPVCMMMVMNSMNFGAFYYARQQLAGANPRSGGAPTWIDWRVVRRGERRAPVRDGQHPVRARQAPGAARRGEPPRRSRRRGHSKRRHSWRRIRAPPGTFARRTRAARTPRANSSRRTARGCSSSGTASTPRASACSTPCSSPRSSTRRTGLRPRRLSPRRWQPPRRRRGAAGWLTNLPGLRQISDSRAVPRGRARGMGRGAGRGRVGFVEAARAVGARAGSPALRRRGSVAGAFFRGEREQVHGVLRAMGSFRAVPGAGRRVADGVGNRRDWRESTGAGRLPSPENTHGE